MPRLTHGQTRSEARPSERRSSAFLSVIHKEQPLSAGGWHPRRGLRSLLTASSRWPRSHPAVTGSSITALERREHLAAVPCRVPRGPARIDRSLGSIVGRATSHAEMITCDCTASRSHLVSPGGRLVRAPAIRLSSPRHAGRERTLGGHPPCPSDESVIRFVIQLAQRAAPNDRTRPNLCL